MALNAQQELDRLAESFGFQFQKNPLDFLRPPGDLADNKLKELKLFLEARKAAAAGDARAQLLSSAALTSANPSPQELASFKPGLPSIVEAGVPAGAVPPATGNPPVTDLAQTPAWLRTDQLDAAAAKNAPAVEAVRRSLALTDAGLDESKIAAARAYDANARLHGGQADEQDFRFQAVKALADNPELDPLLRADLVQKKDVFKKERVKVKRRDGSEVYYDATPNLAGAYNYTPAQDAEGQPLRVPISESGGDRPTALQKNAGFVARVLFAGDPAAEQKAVTMLTQLKGKSAPEAWASLTLAVSKLNFGRYARDPAMLHDKTAELWRVSRPGEPIPVDAPPPPPVAPLAGAPAATAAAEDPLFAQARAAIAQGANPAAVKARLKALGKDPGKL